MGNKWIVTGAIFMLIAIGLGAMGAHALKEQISGTLLESYKTGVLYHIVHALALVLVGIISAQNAKSLNVAGYLFLAGIVCFSGSIYLLSIRELTNFAPKFLVFVTPLGGVLFMAGWLALALSALRKS